MNRGRVVLFLSVVLAALIVAISAMLVQEQNDANKPTPIPSATVAVIMQQPTPVPVLVQPLFGQGVNVNDGLPTYICAADAFGSYFTLQQMVMAGIDVQNGFHLGIVPFSLDEMADYDISEEARVAALRSGQWDCLLTTADSIALSSAGIVTAVVDESAGADQLWARDVSTINDLRDKRITYSRGSVGEYFVLFTLNVARLNPRFDVTLLPVDSVYEAVETFNRGQADVVSGWEPDIYDAAQSGLRVLFGLLMAFILTACSGFPIPISVGATSAPSATYTPEAPPLPTGTATPLPVPTIAPLTRVQSGEQALFYGDYDTARQEFESAYRDGDSSQVKAAALSLQTIITAREPMCFS